MRFRPPCLALCLAVPVLVAAGCGGGSSDADAIRDIVNDVADNPLAICDHLSDAMLKTAFKGDADDCRKAGEDANAKANAGDVDINDVEVKGDTATAKITDKDGTSQTLNFKKDGDNWVLADLGG